MSDDNKTTVVETPKDAAESVENKSEIEQPKTACELEEKPALLQKIKELEQKNNDLSTKLSEIEKDLQAKVEERDNYKNKVTTIESECENLRNKVNTLEGEINDFKSQQPSTLSPAQQTEVEKIKKQSEDMIVRAKAVIFEKTKICKNQELQLEALNQQVTSLKEVVSITRDLLDIRDTEINHLKEQLDNMETKIGIEKQRHDLMYKKLDTMTQMNTDLKNEYQTQLRLFNELREQYHKRNQMNGE